MSVTSKASGKDFTFIDLFAGIGGMRIGFESVGGRCVLTSEIDPAALETGRQVLGESSIKYCDSKESCLVESDFLVILTEWKEFIVSDVNLFSSLKDKTLFDGRNLLDRDVITNAGYKYFCIGK